MRPMQMDLGLCRDGMGAGQVDAAAFLRLIKEGGVEMRFPNVAVTPGGVTEVVPARYFEQGAQLTYTVTIANTAIAGCEQFQGKLFFKGYQIGSTKAEITASNGQKQSFVITVRESTNDNGWM